MYSRTNARLALLLLTALNFLNYIDRSVLFAVQPLVKAEFNISDTQIGYLTSAFFFCYMIAAPLLVPLADRFPRRRIMAAGAFVWSLATLLTAVTHNYTELLIRHTVVGIGEATFVAISPAFLSDLYPEDRRGRIMGLFYLATPVGTALGYLIGGYLGNRHGWRAPFLVCAIPGLLLAFLVAMLPEPIRGASDHLAETFERSSIRGLLRNKAFWTVTLGSAMLTFAIGGLQVWMPTFLTRIRHVPLERGNLIFGGMTVVAGTVATVLGGWLGDRLLRRTPAGYQLISAIGMTLAVPAMMMAIYCTGRGMYPAIFVGEFFLLLNTAPLNAALVNAVGARIRATALAMNIFVIHLLGDAFSPTLIGYISDKSNLQLGMVSMVVAVALSAAILFYGMRFAPKLSREQLAVNN
jgi:multidrug resistance protein